MVPVKKAYVQLNVINLFNEHYFGNLSTSINAFGFVQLRTALHAGVDAGGDRNADRRLLITFRKRTGGPGGTMFRPAFSFVRSLAALTAALCRFTDLMILNPSWRQTPGLPRRPT